MLKYLNTLLLKISISPITFIYLNVIIYFIALINYEYRIDISFPTATLFLIFLFLLTLTIINSNFKTKIHSSITLTGFYWKTYAIVILMSNLLEYFYCGIPFLSLFGIGKHIFYAFTISCLYNISY